MNQNRWILRPPLQQLQQDYAERLPPSRVVIREEWLRDRGEFYIRIIMKMIHINESHINVWKRTQYAENGLLLLRTVE